MSEFSKEYCTRHMPDLDGDFSIWDEFHKLEEGEEIDLLCEGYGFIAIAKEEGKLILVLPDGSEKGEEIL